MPFTQIKTFNINETSVPLSQGDVLTFKFRLKGATTSDFTGSLTQGSLRISSLAASTGYASTDCPYFDSGSLSSSFALGEFNTIVLSAGLTTFHDRNYQFVPNPLTGSLNSLYDEYGDVDYPFVIKPFDIILTYLSDNTYIESRVLEVTKPGNYLNIKLDTEISNFYKENLISGSYQRFLILKRIEDETGVNLTFKKRPGGTSYGFLIPSNLSPDVLNNIDTITKEVKQKLLQEQSGVTINTY